MASASMTASAAGRNEHPVELRSIEAQLGGTKILHDVTLTVEAGEIYGLLGPNGAGKTTTLAVVAGLLAARTALSGSKSSWSRHRPTLPLREWATVSLSAP